MASVTNYLRNKLLDFTFRGQVFVPPANTYVELVSTQPTASLAGSALAGAGYARVAIPASLAEWSGTQGDGTTGVSSGTSGVTSNNNDADFGVAGAAWGTASNWELYDAPTGGNRLLWGIIVDGLGTPAPRIISAGDPVKFPSGALRIQLA
jgi:hypothetical protein